MGLRFPKGFRIPNIFTTSSELGEGFEGKDSPPAAVVDAGATYNLLGGTAISVVTDEEAATHTINSDDNAAVILNTTHRGADGSDHSLLTSKTSYWSIPGVAFSPVELGSDTMYMTAGNAHIAWIESNSGSLNSRGGDTGYYAPVNLPHGAVVTGAICYGSDAGETWTLRRVLLTNMATIVTMASAAINTEDTSITSATIDNSLYAYFLFTSSMDSGDDMDGARIKYTTAYI